MIIPGIRYSDIWIEECNPLHSALYMIKIKDQDIYKIGVSWNPEARLKTLQIGIPFELELIVSVNKYDDSYVAEKKFHKNLNEYNMRGEWFKLPKHIATQTKFRMQNGIH